MEKVKNLPVMRFVAFAVSVAIILALSSAMLSFTACAEEQDSPSTSSSLVGTLGTYQCIKFSYTDDVSCQMLYDKFLSLGTDYVYGSVFGYKDGKFFDFANNGMSYNKSNGTMSFLNVSFYSAWFDVDYRKTSVFCFSEDNGNIVSTYRYMDANATWAYGSKVIISRNTSLSDFPSVYGTDFYAVFTGSSEPVNTDTIKAFKNSVINGYSVNDFTSSDLLNCPRAEFVSFKSAPTGYPEGVLWFSDWIKKGYQYPYFSWYIRDNSNHHSYSIKFSYNKSQVDLCNKVFNNRFYEEVDNVKDDPYAIFKQSGIILLSAKLKTICDNLNLANAVQSIVWDKLSYSDSFTLRSPDMDFSNCENSGNKVYSVCLSDYSDIGRYFIYKADIVDNVTGNVLDTTYFCPLNKFVKSFSGYGSKVYDYGDDGNKMVDELISNTPSITPTIKDIFSSSGNVIGGGDITNNLANVDISSIYSTLVSSASSVGAFFNACMAIIPSAFISIILTGLSLVIILRVLGR